jgi:hypothetical protein
MSSRAEATHESAEAAHERAEAAHERAEAAHERAEAAHERASTHTAHATHQSFTKASYIHMYIYTHIHTYIHIYIQDVYTYTHTHTKCVQMLANASSNTIEARGENSVFFGKIRGLTPPPPAIVVSVGPARGAISCVYSPTNSERIVLGRALYLLLQKAPVSCRSIYTTLGGGLYAEIPPV